MQMRADTNDLQRRLGDVRLNSDKHGVWGKYIGGKSKITDTAYVNQTYNMAQVGYDTNARKLDYRWCLLIWYKQQ